MEKLIQLMVEVRKAVPHPETIKVVTVRFRFDGVEAGTPTIEFVDITFE